MLGARLAPGALDGRARWRRPAGLAALVLGLVAAWWSVADHRVEGRLVLLLTHLDAPVGGARVDRQRLVGLEVLLPDGARVSRRYARGRAPEATEPIAARLGPAGEQIDVRCDFDIGGASPEQRWARVRPEARGGVQVLDVGRCAATER